MQEDRVTPMHRGKKHASLKPPFKVGAIQARICFGEFISKFLYQTVTPLAQFKKMRIVTTSSEINSDLVYRGHRKKMLRGWHLTGMQWHLLHTHIKEKKRIDVWGNNVLLRIRQKQNINSLFSPQIFYKALGKTIYWIDGVMKDGNMYDHEPFWCKKWSHTTSSH